MEKSEVVISGIVCDNPKCDYRDDTVKFEDYPNYVDRPCPKCKENFIINLLKHFPTLIRQTFISPSRYLLIEQKENLIF